MKTYNIDVSINGKAIVKVMSEKPPEDFNSHEAFYGQAEWISSELIEWDVESLDKVSE